MGNDPLDDLRMMGEAVDQIGDTPPTPEDISSVQGTDGGDPPPELESTDEGLVGGIGEPVGGEEPEVTLEDILGAPPSGPASDPEPVETKTETEEPPSGTDARIKELTDRLKATEEREARLMELALQGKPSVEQEEEQGDPLPDLEPDVADYLTPYINKAVADRMGALETAVKPFQEDAEKAQMASSINEYVDGDFTVKDLDALEAHFATLTDPAEKARYSNGLVGAVALAQKVAGGGAPVVAKKTASKLAARHSTDIGGDSTSSGSNLTDEEMAARIDNMSNEDMLKILERMEHQ